MKNKLSCVLLIDDDEPTNFLSKMLIEKTNCSENTQVAQSGEAALRYLNNCIEQGCPLPDLIFLDINMPAMNGWEFLEKYMSEGYGADSIVVVMLTTSLNPDDKSKAHEMPVISGFESKPLTVMKLEEIFKKYFQDHF